MMRLVALVAAVALGGCTKDKDKTAEPVKADTGAAAGDKPPVAGTVVTPAPVIDPNCRVLDKLPGEPPIYVAGKGVVLTRLMKPCVTGDGKRGYDKATPWLAMGFPCTGGSGRVDIKGNYHNPKMVSFILGTDCAMNPPTREQAQKVVAESLGLPPESKLVGYTPFVLQFWEVVGMTDADTGFSIDLRSAPATEGIWKRFKENHPFRVNLYGRENAWVAGGQFYMVEADVRMTGRNSFQVDVQKVKSLAEAELAAVKTRCEALRPTRNCADVF